MRVITAGARSLYAAHGLYSALSEFHPELNGIEDDGYRVSIELGSSDRRIIAVLDILDEYVTERASGPARVEVDGHPHVMHGPIEVSRTAETCAEEAAT
jgi:hypothetical protein